MESSIKYKVQYRGGFSDRNGINKISTDIQLTDLDMRTRTAICNLFYELIMGQIVVGHHGSVFFDRLICRKFFKKLISEVYCLPIASFYYNENRATEYYSEYIEDLIFKGSYGDVFTLLEFLIQFSNEYNYMDFEYVCCGDIVVERINNIFQREYVGYRVIDEKVTPISDENEQKSVDSALSLPFDGCRSHMKKALAFLSDRENPDYKNSIKESISAVESICQIIVNNEKATLGQALKFIEDKHVDLHPSLKRAFTALYGYTSDKGGIRHAEGLFESNVTFEEAKLMLVTCSAFVNYLTSFYDNLK